MGNTIPDMTSRRSPAGVGTPRGSILQEFLETFDQGRIPTPSPNSLLTELGLDPNGPGLSTDLLLSQRELMMRSLLVGSISASQRAQIVNADVVYWRSWGKPLGANGVRGHYEGTPDYARMLQHLRQNPQLRHQIQARQACSLSSLCQGSSAT